MINCNIHSKTIFLKDYIANRLKFDKFKFRKFLSNYKFILNLCMNILRNKKNINDIL
jgi:hypothetical protein